MALKFSIIYAIDWICSVQNKNLVLEMETTQTMVKIVLIRKRHSNPASFLTFDFQSYNLF